MATESVHCPVLNGAVTQITDLEGHVTQIICPQLVHGASLCRVRIRASEGGPLSQLLERVSEHDLQAKGHGCVMV